MAGFAVSNPPRAIETYLFCCPAMDGNFRCLPRAGGMYDQDISDIIVFRVIEEKIAEIRKRHQVKEESELKRKGLA